MPIDREKCRFLFDADEPPSSFDEIDELDEIKDLLKIHSEAAEPRLTGALQRLLARQVIADRPPEVWATAQRLLAQGLDREDVLRQLFIVVTIEIRRMLDDRISKLQSGEIGESGDGHDRDRSRSYDEPRYERALTQLPLPRVSQIMEAIDQAASEHQGCLTAELVERTLERLGRDPDDEPSGFVVEHTIAEGLDIGCSPS